MGKKTRAVGWVVGLSNFLVFVFLFSFCLLFSTNSENELRLLKFIQTHQQNMLQLLGASMNCEKVRSTNCMTLSVSLPCQAHKDTKAVMKTVDRREAIWSGLFYLMNFPKNESRKHFKKFKKFRERVEKEGDVLLTSSEYQDKLIELKALFELGSECLPLHLPGLGLVLPKSWIVDILVVESLTATSGVSLVTRFHLLLVNV